MMVKIIWDLTGYYQRLSEDSTAVSQTSLSNLLDDVRAIATHQKRHYLPQVHQLFGLDFLPVHTVTHLMQQTSGRSPLVADQILRPLVQDQKQLQSQNFCYYFITNNLDQNFRIPLRSDNSQIPKYFGNDDRCEGIYQLELSSNSPNPIIVTIRTQAINDLRAFIQTQPLEIIHLALQSKDPNLFSVSLPNNCTAWVNPQELSSEFQQVLAYLRREQNDDTANSDLVREQSSENVQSIIQNYQLQYPQPIIISDRIPVLEADNVQSRTELLIGRGVHRQGLRALIENSQKFLLICSYRLEDQDIVDLIAEKSKRIPVWILTDFSDEVQDRVDRNLEGQREADPEYANSDQRKKQCLNALSRANVGFRSGDFHLKTYISEQSAYLGSCNLTGGSLGRNGEAGILWSRTQEYQFLIDYFRYLWQCKTTAQSVPTPQGFRCESVKPIADSPPQNQHFLNQHYFSRDLSKSLQTFPKEPVWIYTRNFQPQQQHINFLQARNRQYRVFYGAFNNSPIECNKIQYLHAKIIIIGSKVAYLGSQDFAFRPNPLIELTYKITDPQIINQLIQQRKKLH